MSVFLGGNGIDNATLVNLVGVLIGIQVAFNALFLVYINAVTRDKVSKVAQELKEIERSSFFVAKTAKHAATALVTVEEMLSKERALMHRALQGSPTSATVLTRTAKEWKQDISTVKKAVQTLILFAHSENDDEDGWDGYRRNALFQLCEELGDAQTLDDFRELSSYETALRPELKSAIRTLRTRLGRQR